jgi:hypothetical protein
VAWNDASLLVVTSSVSGELENLSSEVLEQREYRILRSQTRKLHVVLRKEIDALKLTREASGINPKRENNVNRTSGELCFVNIKPEFTKTIEPNDPVGPGPELGMRIALPREHADHPLLRRVYAHLDLQFPMKYEFFESNSYNKLHRLHDNPTRSFHPQIRALADEETLHDVDVIFQ